jgi:hypothetical protein
MRHREAIRIPNFQELPVPAAYSPTGLAARAIFLQNVATAWHKAGDDETATKMQRDADDQTRRFEGLGPT